MTPRVLVAYASKHGSTREVAEAIAATLAGHGLEVDCRAMRDVRRLDGYEAVIIGSALYAAHWQRDANRFVARHRESLRNVRLWVFSSGPLDHAHAAADLPISAQAAGLLDGVPYVAHRTFGGRLDPTAPDIDPQILATHPAGDFRDWVVIRTWAADIARALTAS